MAIKALFRTAAAIGGKSYVRTLDHTKSQFPFFAEAAASAKKQKSLCVDLMFVSVDDKNQLSTTELHIHEMKEIGYVQNYVFTDQSSFEQ